MLTEGQGGRASGILRPRIAGLGIACLDYLFLTPPAAAGGQAPLREYAITGGGLVATALVAAARLGAQAEIITWVGEDQEGEAVLAGLREEGVDVSRAEVVLGGTTPASFIHVEEGSGERTIYHRGGLEVSGPRIAAVTRQAIACDAALVDAVWPEAGLTFARQAREAGVPVVGDFCPHEGLRELAVLVTALIVPRACGERLSPEGSWKERLSKLASLGPGLVGITAGEEGCYYLEAGEMGHQPAFPVEVVDTTGAGDVFHGALAYALGRGWASARGIEFAAAVAALSCRALGGRRAIPSLDEATEFLRRHGSDRWDW